jgi:hypothetical protein
LFLHSSAEALRIVVRRYRANTRRPPAGCELSPGAVKKVFTDLDMPPDTGHLLGMTIMANREIPNGFVLFTTPDGHRSGMLHLDSGGAEG